MAIAYAREGADVLISHLPDEEEDARDTARWVEDAGRTVVRVPGDLSDPAHCREVVARAVKAWGRIDVLVSNAAFQMTRRSLEEIPDQEWDHTPATNLSAMFHLCKAAVPHMKPGSSIIASSSVNSDMPPPAPLPYNVTKAGLANMVGSMSQLLAERGIRSTAWRRGRSGRP